MQVQGTDRGVLLSREGHAEVDKLAADLSKYCVEEPVKCPLIFGGNERIIVGETN